MRVGPFVRQSICLYLLGLGLLELQLFEPHLLGLPLLDLQVLDLNLFDTVYSVHSFTRFNHLLDSILY